MKKYYLLYLLTSLALVIGAFTVFRSYHTTAPTVGHGNINPKNIPLGTEINTLPPEIAQKSAAQVFAHTVENRLPTTGLLSEYNSITDGRVFVHKNLNNLASGGLYYSSKIADQCSAFAGLGNILTKSQPDIDVVGTSNFVNASKALQRLQARCAQFTEDELAKLSGRSSFASQNAKDDPLIGSLQALIEAGSKTDMRTKAVAEILRLSDPLVLDDIGMRLSIATGTKGAYLFLDGQKYPIKEEPALAAAFYLLPCGLGLACDSSDPLLSLRCVTGQGCYANRFEVVKSEMSGRFGEKYPDILTAYYKLVAALQAGDASRFVPAIP